MVGGIGDGNEEALVGALGTPVVVVSSFLMFACGASPHDRAEEVMQSAVERFSVLQARVDGVILAAEERGRGGCEGVDPVPNINLVFAVPRDVRALMQDVNTEYMGARAGCNLTLVELRRQLNGMREFRDRLVPDAVTDLVSVLRARLATVSADALERVLDAAGTDEEAWVALNHVNSSGFGSRVLDFVELDLRFAELEAVLNRQLNDVARYRPIAVQKKTEFYELAGQPVPEP